MASWLEVTLDAHGDPDALCAKLSELGYTGFSVEDEADFHRFLDENAQYWDFVDQALEDGFKNVSRVKLWLPDDADGEAKLAQLQKLGLAPSSRRVEDADWENNWRDYYKPLEIGKKLVVVPEWEAFDGPRVPVVLDPGLLFGTGQHPTTRLCLEAAEVWAGPGKTVLDLGCGSGILGIAAVALGCGRVTAVDIDPKAPEIVAANAALNGSQDAFTVRVGDVVADGRLRRALGGGYDLVFANIVADVILPLAAFVPDFLAEDGVFIASGVIDGREAEVESALQSAGLTVLDHRTGEEWHCFVCRKGPEASDGSAAVG